MPIIPKEREAWFLGLFAVQFFIWLALAAIRASWDNPISAAIDTGRTMASLAILSTATTVVAVEGGTMLAERYLQRRYREGKAAGKAAGKAEGEANKDRAWVDWLQRKSEAEAKGEKFTEPNPAEQSRANG